MRQMNKDGGNRIIQKFEKVQFHNLIVLMFDWI